MRRTSVASRVRPVVAITVIQLVRARTTIMTLSRIMNSTIRVTAATPEVLRARTLMLSEEAIVILAIQEFNREPSVSNQLTSKIQKYSTH